MPSHLAVMTTKPHRLLINKINFFDTVAEIITPDGRRRPLGTDEGAPSTSTTGATVQMFNPYFKTRDAAIDAAKAWMAENAPGQALTLAGKPVKL